jgi:hypothetical protein
MENCDGCGMNNRYTEEAVCLPHNKKGSCPCTNCIVKIMCKSFCEMAADWWIDHDDKEKL